MNDEMYRSIMKSAFIAHLQMQQIDKKVRIELQEMFGGTNERRRYLEHHNSIQTSVTDEDMLLLQIDHALDNGDAELFAQLTEKLKEMEVAV